MYDFNGKVALVTGAATGIGRAALLQLARGGATVIAVDMNEEGVKDVAEEARALGVEAYSAAVDISREDCVGRMMENLLRDCGHIDILVNNAGIWRTGRGPFAESSSAAWRQRVEVNILGTMYMTHAVLPSMIERRYGRIINLSSVAGFLIKMLFLLMFERIFGWDVVWCNLSALLISGLFNYFLTDVWVFRKPKTLPEE
jgi:3-oxoacyl-[acyl-carrier protein] reductase